LRISKFSDVEEHLNIWTFYTFPGIKKYQDLRQFAQNTHTHTQRNKETNKQTIMQYLVKPLLIFLCSPQYQQSHHGDSIQRPNKKTGKVNERCDVSSNDEY
jgi:hypothetical protein